MKVKELIEKLNSYPEDCTVYIYSDDAGVTNINSVDYDVENHSVIINGE